MQKIILFISLVLSSCLMNAQNISFSYTIIPPGYTSQQAQQINDVKVISDTLFWIAFQQIGLARYDGTTWTLYNTSNSALPSNTIQAVEVDASGRVWAGTPAGLAGFDGTIWTIYHTMNSGITGNHILSLKATGNNLWIGTRSGVSYFDGVSFSNYTTANSALSNDTIHRIVIHNNEVWFCTSQGLNRFVNNTWAAWYFPEGLITNVAFDFNGDAWVVTHGKLYRLNLNSGNSDDFEQTLFPEKFNEQIDLFIPRYALVSAANGDIYFLLKQMDSFSRFGNIFRYSLSGLEHYYVNFDSLHNPFIRGTYLFTLSGNRLLIASRMAITNKFLIYDFSASPPDLEFNFSLENIKSIDRNNVKARVLTRGDMHWNTASQKYEVPQGSHRHTVFASAFWIGGLDENGQLRVAAQTYRQSGIVNFYPGPIQGINMPFDSASCQRYDRIWKINADKIEEFKINFLNGNVSNGTYTIPDDFKTWPANGNNGLTGSFAPTVDYNNDGIYNPYDGDYPKITGDQMLFWLFNDSLNRHYYFTDSSLTLGLEVHAKAYAFERYGTSALHTALNNTTFYHYRIINRSPHNYDSVYIGLWSDLDLGNYLDDLIGCDSSLNAGYVFNGDNNDEGSNGYGINPPMQSVLVLSGPQAYAGDGIDNNNNGLTDEPAEDCRMTGFFMYENVSMPPLGTPQSAVHFYNYMRSRDYNGQPVADPLTGVNSNFMYNGTPYSPTFPVSGVIIPGDRRFIIGTGPFRLLAGEETCIEFAFIFSRDTTGPNGLNTSVAANIAAIQAVHAFYRDSIHSSCAAFPAGIQQPPSSEVKLRIFPNPVTNYLRIEIAGTSDASAFEITDLSGRKVLSGTLRHPLLSVELLSSGLYFITVKTNKGMLAGKFIKQ